MSLVSFLHRFTFLRRWAKKICRGWTIRQSFHGGKICLDAVEHSWAWTTQQRYQTFDDFLQTCLLELSQRHSHMIDLGANIGAMGLSVMLRNSRISVDFYDPNPQANQLLKQSLKINQEKHRARVFSEAISMDGKAVRFDFEGSVIGHVSVQGEPVETSTASTIFERVPEGKSILLKVDIEGFEVEVLKALTQECRKRQATMVLEIHPLGLNGIGSPRRCWEILRQSGAHLEDHEFAPLTSAPDANFTHVVATWNGS